MKPIVFFLGIVLFASSTEQYQITQLDWLVGTWARKGNDEKRQSFEVWSKTENGNLSGFGYTVKNGDTTFKENLEIVKRDGNLFYVANVAENQGPVFFKCTEVSDTLFICENPLHDFPKKIAYRRDGDNLYAQIWDEKNRVDFSFIRAD